MDKRTIFEPVVTIVWGKRRLAPRTWSKALTFAKWASRINRVERAVAKLVLEL